MLIIYSTNRSHFCVRLYRNRSQITSWRAKNKKVLHETKSSAVMLCSSHVFCDLLLHTGTKNEMYLFYIIKEIK